MKKHSSLILLLTILVSGCSQEEILKNETAKGKIFTASFEQNESRTYIEEGNLLRWTEGDQISLFDGNTLNRQYKFEGKTGDNAGTFSIVNAPYGSGNDLTANYAIYPYASDVKITEDGIITATLPATQNYAANSFGLGANTMVAVTEDTDDTFLKFRNVGGYLKLQLYGDDVAVKSITLTGNNSEKLVGTATITPVYGQDPTISMADDATNSITLDCGDGVEIGTTTDDATAFWIVVPPTTFENGFEITITDVNGNKMTKSTSNKISITRNVIKPMAAFEVETVETIPNNQIWYTSSDGQIVTPVATNAFGANINSNVYENGKGIITFDADVTMLGEGAFNSCTSLTSVIFPNSVTKIGISAFFGCSSLTDITLPNNLTSIGESAFHGCALESIKIPKSVTSLEIGANALKCSLTSIVVKEGNTVYDSRDNCNAIIETASNTLIVGCTNTIIPNSVTKIGENAFGYCNSKMTNITIPNSVTTIGYGAFGDCTSLTSITIPNSVTNIEGYPLPNCTSLSSIVVEQGNTVYDSRDNSNAIIETASNTLISGCKNTVIPNSVTTIGFAAFYWCASLTNITIPNSVTTIGTGAFMYCSSLAEVHVKATNPPIIDSSTFIYCSNNPTIYVPAESLASYQAADYWKDLNLLAEENAEVLLLPDGPTFNSTVGDFMKSMNYTIKNIKFITNSNTTSESILVTDENGTMGYLVAND